MSIYSKRVKINFDNLFKSENKIINKKGRPSESMQTARNACRHI